MANNPVPGKNLLHPIVCCYSETHSAPAQTDMVTAQQAMQLGERPDLTSLLSALK